MHMIISRSLLETYPPTCLVYKFLIFGLVAVFITGIYFTNDAFGIDFNDIDVTSSQTLLFEGIDTNVIVVKMKIVNNSNEEFSVGYSSTAYLVSSTDSYYEPSLYNIDIVGDRTCPLSEDIPAGITKDATFCYEIPKNLLTSFSFEIFSYMRSFCDDGGCQKITTVIKNPIKTDYNEHKKSFISTNTSIDAKFESVDLIEQDGFNILKVDFNLTNLSTAEINYYMEYIIVITPDGTEYTASRYDLTNLGYDYSTCDQLSIDVNPRLTKSYSYCYEVPQEFKTFDLSIRNEDFGNCDNSYYSCSEYLLNISNPKFIELEKPELSTPIEETLSEDTESSYVLESTSLGIASFVDQTKDPQHYIDRYNNEPKYKEWFDENYPQYISIYEAVGLPEPFLPMTNPTPIDPCTTSWGMSDASTYECQKANAYSKLYTNNKQPSGYLALQDQESKNQRSKSMCARGMELVGDTCQLIETKIKESEGGGCLIATATYGSELAPQVQLLREIRDNSLLQTESGSAFMSGFNEFYYSFSPTIADWERESPMFKEAVKLAITPMITTLSIMENANSESEVLGLGLSVIALNLAMYLGIPAVVIVGIRKRF